MITAYAISKNIFGGAAGGIGGFSFSFWRFGKLSTQFVVGHKPRL
jgi:hypothetical protein